jgi:hypothetical protein
VNIRSVQHKGLLRLLEDDDPRGIPPDFVKRVRNILAVVIVARDVTQVTDRLAGISISFEATAPEHGAFQSAAIGG